MNKIKLEAITLIRNSQIAEKDSFLDFVLELSDKDCLRLIYQAKIMGIETVWNTIKKKQRIIKMITESAFLESEQKEILKKVVIENVNAKGLEKIINNKIDIKKEKERIDTIYRETKEKIEKARRETEDIFNKFVEKIKKQAEGEIINKI